MPKPKSRIIEVADQLEALAKELQVEAKEKSETNLYAVAGCLYTLVGAIYADDLPEILIHTTTYAVEAARRISAEMAQSYQDKQ